MLAGAAQQHLASLTCPRKGTAGGVGQSWSKDVSSCSSIYWFFQSPSGQPSCNTVLCNCCPFRPFSGWVFCMTWKSWIRFDLGEQHITAVCVVMAKLHKRKGCLWSKRVNGLSLFKVFVEMGNFLLAVLNFFGGWLTQRLTLGALLLGRGNLGHVAVRVGQGPCIFLSFLFFRPFHLSRSPPAFSRLSSLPHLAVETSFLRKQCRAKEGWALALQTQIVSFSSLWVC